MYRDREIDSDIQDAEVDDTSPKNHGRKAVGHEYYWYILVNSYWLLPAYIYVMEISGTLGNELGSSVRL